MLPKSIHFVTSNIDTYLNLKIILIFFLID